MRTPLNVIFIGSFLYPNGYASTNRKQQFLEYIISQGDTARVLITLKLARGNEMNDLKGVYRSVPYEVIGACVKKNIFLPITFLYFLFKSFVKLIKLKKKNTRNVLVVFGVFPDTIIILLFAKLIGYKIIFDIVEDFSVVLANNKKTGGIKSWFLRYLSCMFIKRLACGLSVVSIYLKQKYINDLKNIPIEIVRISASNISLELKKNQKLKFRLLYSGSYGEKEGLPIMFEGFSKFLSYVGDVELVLTGECPDSIKEILREKLGDLDDILFAGRLNDDQYFQTLMDADVLLMTRNNSAFANAGFPYKIGEYLATGNPVVCTKVSDIELYLEDRKSAFLINPEDSDELFEVLKYIFNNRTEALKIGLRGRMVAEKYFNPDVNSKLFYSLLENLD